MKELLNKLPQSWEQVTLEQFQKMSSTPITEEGTIFDGMENSIAVMSKLLDVSVDELESMSMIDLATLGNRISFMTTEPQPDKTSPIKWKKVEEISYNDFLVFIQLQDKQLENLHTFIKTFSHTTLTEDEILQLPITQVIWGFFLFRNQLRQSLKASIKSTRQQLVKHLIKKKLQEFKQKMKW